MNNKKEVKGFLHMDCKLSVNFIKPIAWEDIKFFMETPRITREEFKKQLEHEKKIENLRRYILSIRHLEIKEIRRLLKEYCEKENIYLEPPFMPVD